VLLLVKYVATKLTQSL